MVEACSNYNDDLVTATNIMVDEIIYFKAYIKGVEVTNSRVSNFYISLFVKRDLKA